MKLIFLCTANSCRSQMAEAWARVLMPEGWRVASAGLMTYPITRETRNAMEAVGVGMEGQVSKSVDGVDLDDFDLVVTLSGESTRFLPNLAHPERHLKRPIRDPMSFEGSRDEIREAFARGRDQVRAIVEEAITTLGGRPETPPNSS